MYPCRNLSNICRPAQTLCRFPETMQTHVWALVRHVNNIQTLTGHPHTNLDIGSTSGPMSCMITTEQTKHLFTYLDTYVTCGHLSQLLSNDQTLVKMLVRHSAKICILIYGLYTSISGHLYTQLLNIEIPI